MHKLIVINFMLDGEKRKGFYLTKIHDERDASKKRLETSNANKEKEFERGSKLKEELEGTKNTIKSILLELPNMMNMLRS